MNDKTDPPIEFGQSLIASRVTRGLDRLGNWTEAADGYEGRVEHEDLDGSAGYEALVLAQDHTTDLRNELTGIDTDIGNGPVSTPHIHDAAGNLVADGVYYYQYDAFNRLAAVYEQNTLTFDADGIPESGEPGAWRAKYAYDALGRRVCKQVPWHTGDARMAWYYYDGVRRVQEVFRDPLPSGSLAGNPNPLGNYTVYTDREYVWGPDYVDECLWQVDRTGASAFVLQDANYNVVALIDETGQVLQQFDYDPYGSVRELDELAAYADNRIGFQGLFADRHDTDAPNPEIAVGAVQTYYARNRDYRSDLGRWMQRDPVGSSLSALESMAFHGSAAAPNTAVADAARWTADGLRLHGFLRSRPSALRDPSGLFAGVIGTLVVQAIDMYDMAVGALDEALAGVSMALDVNGMVEAYAFEQTVTADLVGDWDVSDDFFTYGANGSGDAADSGNDGDPAYAQFPKPRKKRAWDPKRQHGSTPHWRGMKAEYRKLLDTLKARGIEPRYNTVRTNQALVDANGNVLRRSDGRLIRPDVQFVDKNGKVHIIEIGVSQRQKSLDALEPVYKKILGDAFGSYSSARYP